MDGVVLGVFAIVYLGMFLGRLPGLALDRTGIALLGAIALVGADRLTAAAAWDAIDVPTIALLFGLMVISAQFRLGGFYAAATRRMATSGVGPFALLGLVITLAGGLSAVLANDVVCLAVAPVLIDACARRGFDPVPQLLGLACAANVGSAATLVGNPQNMLIGQVLSLSFSGYLLDGAVPAVLGLAATWAVIAALYRGRWRRSIEVPAIDEPPFDRWQTIKAWSVLAAVVGLFLFSEAPREVVALSGAGVLLASRRMHSRGMLGQVDWQLLVLFIGLFVVHRAIADSGAMSVAVAALDGHGIAVEHPAWMFALAVVLSNLVSNVPAVMLLLPSATHPEAGAVLALASTLAGNLFIIGSIANLIVVEQADRLGVRIGWREHARVGVPVTLGTLAIAALWLVVS